MPGGPSGQSDEAAVRRELIAEVQGLQRSLEEINQQMASTKKENADLAMENSALSSYIDALMENIAEMGSKIVADKAKRRAPPSRGNAGRSPSQSMSPMPQPTSPLAALPTAARAEAQRGARAHAVHPPHSGAVASAVAARQ